MTGFTPLGPNIHLRLSRPAEKSKGGVWLPEVRAHKATEGMVLATGPGHWIAGTAERAIVWLMAGDICLFLEHHWTPVGEREGVVHEEDIVATVDPEDNRLTPEGDWVLVDPDPAPQETRGGIALADQAQAAPRSGVVLALGPGLLRFRGPFAGLRNPVWRALSLPDEAALLSKRAYWDAQADVLHAVGKVLVRGRELLCLEE